MRLTPPKGLTFLLSTVLFGLAVASQFFTSIPYVAGNELWFFIAGYMLLWLSNLLSGL